MATSTDQKMQSFITNDNITLKYSDTGAEDAREREKPWLIFLHGFSGSSLVFQHNISAFASHYRVIAPDLRGHGTSDKPTHGFQVSRLAMDLRELVLHLDPEVKSEWRAVGGSLGCAVLWAYASLFTHHPFTHTIFIDQSPLQDLSPATGWTLDFCNRGMNSSSAVSALRSSLAENAEEVHKGTIAACLSYRAYPEEGSGEPREGDEKWETDERFFLAEAMRCDGEFLANLMSDHTSLDWRASIAATLGPSSPASSPSSKPQVLVITSTRSGCFPAAGPLAVVDLVNSGLVGGGNGEKGDRAKGIAVPWGGHWCYWEDPDRFNRLCLRWLEGGEVVDV